MKIHTYSMLFSVLELQILNSFVSKYSLTWQQFPIPIPISAADGWPLSSELFYYFIFLRLYRVNLFRYYLTLLI